MEEKRLLDVIGLIALRKTELVHRVMVILKKERLIREDDKEKVEAIVKYISGIENERLLSNIEKSNKKLNPKSKIEDLGIDIGSIIKEVKKHVLKLD